MDSIQQQLLRPSLGGQQGRVPYSETMIFMSAFFGGPLAALGGFALNVQRLGRWRQDALPMVLAVALLGGLLFLLARSALLSELSSRLIALALALAGLWRHRLEQRSAALMGSQRPSGWLPGMGLILGSYAVVYALRALQL